jgi:hypothetical protein
LKTEREMKSTSHPCGRGKGLIPREGAKNITQGPKPISLCGAFGPAEAVPFYKTLRIEFPAA